MRPFDWLVVVAYIGWIVIDGLKDPNLHYSFDTGLPVGDISTRKGSVLRGQADKGP
jgi:hypothetical protein